MGEEGGSLDFDLRIPNGPALSPPLSDACGSSGNFGLEGEMVEGTASNLPSRSEGSELRLTERGVAVSFSSPFLRPKTFDRNEGIAACPVVMGLGMKVTGVGVCLSTRFLLAGVLRHRGGAGGELTGHEAWVEG